MPGNDRSLCWELGYWVTVVYSDKEMHAALDVNIPRYATSIVTTKGVVDLMSSAQALGLRA
jgi:ureidoacrylate peracid hydrolase